MSDRSTVNHHNAHSIDKLHHVHFPTLVWETYTIMIIPNKGAGSYGRT